MSACKQKIKVVIKDRFWGCSDHTGVLEVIGLAGFPNLSVTFTKQKLKNLFWKKKKVSLLFIFKEECHDYLKHLLVFQFF